MDYQILNTKKAFTLVELLIVISVIGILTMAAIPVFTTAGSNQILVQNAENLKSDIRGVQAKSLSGAVNGLNGYWGVRFVCNGGKAISYIIGQPASPTNPLTDVSGQLKNFSTGVYVECTANFQVVFLKLTGKPADGIGVTIRVNDGNGHTQVIEINSQGNVQ